MTANQIAYQRHLEDMRHNRESEDLNRRDVATKETQALAATDQAFSARKQAEAALIKAKSEASKNVFSNVKSVFDMATTAVKNIIPANLLGSNADSVADIVTSVLA